MPPSREVTPPDPTEWGVTPSEARALLLQQICPVCSRGPWKSPLNHVALKHGIDKHTMRDICELQVKESVADPEFSEQSRQRVTGQDMSAINAGRRAKLAKKKRMTRAGVRSLREGALPDSLIKALTNSHTPEARAKRREALQRAWKEMPPDERTKRTSHLNLTPELRSKLTAATYDTKGRTPCGTESSYKRGCRCDECVEAMRANRREYYARKKAGGDWQRPKEKQPCGTQAAYRRGCRCPECIEGNRAYKRDWATKKRRKEASGTAAVNPPACQTSADSERGGTDETR